MDLTWAPAEGKRKRGFAKLGSSETHNLIGKEDLKITNIKKSFCISYGQMLISVQSMLNITNLGLSCHQ